MKLVTLTEVAELTGKAWRTVKAAVASGNLEPSKRTKKSDLYDSAAVLERLYAGSSNIDDEDLDPVQEKARKDKESADKLAMENAVRRAQLADVRVVEKTWSDLIGNAKVRILGMHAKLGPQLVNIADASVISAAIRAEAHAALTELAAYDPAGCEPGDGGRESVPAVEPAAAVDGEPVGRRPPKAQQRKRGRAGAVAN